MMLDKELHTIDKTLNKEKTVLENKLDEDEVRGGKITMTSDNQLEISNQNGGDGKAPSPAIREEGLNHGGAAKPRVSQKKLEANRKNAKKGGVKTPQGKAVSRLNAVKHGLLCQDLVLPGEKEEAYVELVDRLISALQPVGELEKRLVLRIAWCIWRLERAQRVETAILDNNMDRRAESALKLHVPPGPFLAYCGLDTDSMQKYLRYETATAKELYRALHELERVQLARKGAATHAPIALDVAITNES